MIEPAKPASKPIAAWLAAGGATIALSLAVLLGPKEGDTRIPYPDHVGVLTVCKGVTGPGVVKGKRYTDAECAALEQAHLTRMLAYMGRCVTEPVTEGELLAYGHFTYNIGEAAFCRSTLVKKLNAGDHAGACQQMARFTWAGGKDCRVKANKCSGLPKRRDYEVAMCMESIQ